MVNLPALIFVDALERLEGSGAPVEVGEQGHRISSPDFLIPQRLVLLVLPVVARNDQDDNILSLIAVDDADDPLGFRSLRLLSHGRNPWNRPNRAVGIGSSAEA